MGRQDAPQARGYTERRQYGGEYTIANHPPSTRMETKPATSFRSPPVPIS